jgi:hypothetical protein
MKTEEVKNKLKINWNISPFNFWIPLAGNIEENTLYFDTEDFEKNIPYEKLNQIIREINVGNIYSFNEWKDENVYTELLIKKYNSPDIFFTNENADWVIYQTHEDTIAFAGKELIEKIKSSWENWKDCVNPWY